MVRVKKDVVHKKPKQKAKPEKKNIIGPRLRLEPRLNSNKTVQINNDNEVTKNNNNGQIKSEFCSKFKTKEEDFVNNIETENSISDVETATAMEQDGVDNGINTFVTDTIEFDQFVSERAYIKGLSNSRRRWKPISGSRDWSDEEFMRLTAALQMFGMGDLDKVAELVETKNETAVRDYLKVRLRKLNAEERSRRLCQSWNSFHNPNMDLMPLWPNVRKWRKIAFNQMLPLSRQKDYSRPVLTSLCERFCEEAEEVSDPQVIDVKSIYKFMSDCINGNIPAQLPPKESTLVLELLKEAKLMTLQYDFEEERKFLHNFKAATRFKQKDIKDEFKKKAQKKTSEDMEDPEAIGVPESVYMDLSRHKRLVQGFNPLMTPLWMLQNEQVSFEKYIQELCE